MEDVLVYKETFGDKLSDTTYSILNIIEENPGLPGEKIVEKASEQLTQFSKMKHFSSDIFYILDVLMNEEILYFDFAEDKWYVNMTANPYS